MNYDATSCGTNDPNYDVTVYLDPSMHETYMSLASSSLLYRAAAPTTSDDISMQDRLSAFAGKPTETRTWSALSHLCGTEKCIIPLHEFTSPRPHGESSVTVVETEPIAPCDVYANY